MCTNGVFVDTSKISSIVLVREVRMDGVSCFFFDFSFGYPDATYLERVQQELAALGVTEKSIAEHGSDKK